MSKKLNQQQQDEEQDQEEYQPTLGQKPEKPLNEEALLSLVNKAKNKKNKGKKGKHAEQHEAATAQGKKKKTVVVLDDPTNMAEVQKALKPTIAKSESAQESTVAIVEAQMKDYSNAAILATVGGHIEEADVLRIFSGMALQSIQVEPTYFIIEFMNEDDLKTGLKKNKTMYKNNITILIGEYSIEDENPKPKRNDSYSHDRSYNRNENSSYDDRDDRPQRNIGFGQRTQEPRQPSQPQRPSNSFMFGSQSQISPGQSQQPPRQQQQYGAYQPPMRYARREEQQQPSIQVGVNKFGGLKD
ncbi:hypothetical protein TRFO_35160 [Tritrichomonas foetus]|uniref:Uncharacterized protein n=1 Tax=Tritrichomonas foetus TaxID=1144522 RepID=A0A1J4JJB2_9EUKA|nr:hypothetical protein TRFO_35160 [Tritrichomonas foetus]|eukprot:OHS98423.1 hypothetical protein TRFO_35160 [Tritrichomonas foetus]